MINRIINNIQNDRGNKITNNFYMLLLFITSLSFALLYFNRAATDWEGPDNFCALLMNSGEMIYKDFFYYIPPVYILRCLVTWFLFNGEILPLRFLGITERVILFLIIYRILIRRFKPYIAYIACFLGFLLYNSLTFNSYGDYTQYSQIFVAIAILFTIYFDKAFTKYDRKAYIWLAIASFFLIQSVMSKQSIGAAAIVFMFCALVLYLIIRKAGKRVWGCLGSVVCGTVIGLLPYFVWLLSNQALFDFIDQVFLLSLNSKGLASTSTSTAEVTLIERVGRAIFNRTSLGFDSLLLLCLVIGFWKKKKEKANKLVAALEYICGIGAAFFAAQIINIRIVITNISNTLVYLGEIHILYYFVVLVLILILGYIISNKVLKKTLLQREYSAIAILTILIFITWIAMSCIPTEQLQEILNRFNLGVTIPGFYELFFHVSNVTSIAEIFRRFILKDAKYPIVFIFYLAALDANAVISLIGGGSATFSANGCLFVIPLTVCIICSISPQSQALRRVAKTSAVGVAVFSVFIISAVTMGQHLRSPYSWYGWNSEPITDATSYTIDFDRYTGMLVSKQTKMTLEEVSKLVSENSEEDDFVFTFPGGKIYNILTNRITMPTRVVYYMFDVCPDNYAIADAEILKRQMPDVIVWKELGEEVWKEFENNYRNGGQLGQREIQKWFESVRDTEYTLVGQVYNESVYVKNDGREINYTSFISAEEMYSNIDEVQDNINNSDVFRKTSEMFAGFVNIGNNSIYIIQVVLSVALLFFLFRFQKRVSTALLVFSILLGFCLYVSTVYFFIIWVPLLMWIFTEKKTKLDFVIYIMTLAGGLLLFLQWVPAWRQLKFVFYGITVVVLILSIVQTVIFFLKEAYTKKRKKNV